MIALTPEGIAMTIVACGVVLTIAILTDIRRMRRVQREILQRQEEGAVVRRLVADVQDEAMVQAALARRLREDA